MRLLLTFIVSRVDWKGDYKLCKGRKLSKDKEVVIYNKKDSSCTLLGRWFIKTNGFYIWPVLRYWAHCLKKVKFDIVIK